ncbi:hypothetical protein [Nannocystis bainbridge]|uniref:Uncharacterized protein n=1 Tax=Nannocystis bainbridge TaxID=2995303 RepID=A0ABT5E3Z1_9BACT|nr:hypothetical protein [Nannocystis bainbridge]MDC0720561.1 hypothetical protein [Nannocystis bainbridge]
MRRDVRELLALIAAGLVLGALHLALRPDLPWVPPPREEETMCGEVEPDLEASADDGAPASFAPAAPMSSPGPEDVR